MSHGYFEEVNKNVVVLIPKPITYEEGLINPLTQTPKPDGTITIEGSLKDVADRLEQILKQVDE